MNHIEHGYRQIWLGLVAPDLLEAAKLTVLHFKRMAASGNFLGDDEHECWTALEKAISKAEGRDA